MFVSIFVAIELTLSSSWLMFVAFTVASPVVEMSGLFLLLNLTDTFTFGDPKLFTLVSPSPRKTSIQ